MELTNREPVYDPPPTLRMLLGIGVAVAAVLATWGLFGGILSVTPNEGTFVTAGRQAFGASAAVATVLASVLGGWETIKLWRGFRPRWWLLATCFPVGAVAGALLFISLIGTDYSGG